MDRIKNIKLKTKQIIKNWLYFINKTIQPIFYRNKQNKLNKIKEKQQKYTEENTTQNSEVVEFFKKKYHYTIQPHEHYIQNNISGLLENIQSFFKNKNYIPCIGIEIEFYSLDKIPNVEEFYKKIYNFSSKNNINIYEIEQERGIGQFEIKFQPYQNITKLIIDFNLLKNFLLNNFNITFYDLPFKNDCGSALQINLTLIDKNTQKNLFSRNENKTQESKLLLNSVAGLLKTTNLFLPFYLSKTKNTDRLNKFTNMSLYTNGKIPAPTCNSWGINNRTCSIRIPIPKNIYQFDNYFKNDDENRRLEFRVPSAEADLTFVLFCILDAVAFGIKNDLEPIEATYNNVLINGDKYETIELKEYEIAELAEILNIINIKNS